MSTSHHAFLGGAIGAIGLAAALAGPPQLLNMDLGLWEYTTHPDTSGPPPLPADMLAKLSPEQRAKIIAAVSKPLTLTLCMTAEKRAQGLGGEKSSDPGCKKTVLTASSSEYEVREVCTSPDNSTRSMTQHWKFATPRQATATTETVITQNGNATTSHNRLEAKWLSADCGSEK